jgi:hypothetical protein
VTGELLSPSWDTSKVMPQDAPAASNDRPTSAGRLRSGRAILVLRGGTLLPMAAYTEPQKTALRLTILPGADGTTGGMVSDKLFGVMRKFGSAIHVSPGVLRDHRGMEAIAELATGERFRVAIADRQTLDVIERL